MNAVGLASLGWLAGHWRCEVWGGEFEETWTAPCADHLQGMGRFTVDGRVRFVEFMSIEASQEGLTMFMVLGELAQGAKEPVAFPLARAGEEEAVFTRPGDEYPSRITYVRRGERLFCRIDGELEGQPNSDEFDFAPA